MTKKEAIDMCMEVRDYLTSGNPIWDKDKVGEALDTAIEALKCKPTVIRCEELLSKEDFEAVAKRIHEENQNVIIIPCEAEVVSTNTSTNTSTKSTNISTDAPTEALERECADEWCTDCKEYDTEKKCCPRFNRVIRGAMKRIPHDDGTLEVKVEDATKIGRVLITDDKHRGGLYYPDEDEPQGDLISRADAIEALGEEPPVWCDEEYEIAERDQWRADIEAIKSVPSADRPRGEWIHSPNGIDRDFIWWVCSECGHKIFSETEKDRIEFHAYCGRCGADMRTTKGEK